MLAMRIFDNDPHFVISINIFAQNQISGKDDEDNVEDSDNKHDVIGVKDQRC